MKLVPVLAAEGTDATRAVPCAELTATVVKDASLPSNYQIQF